MSSSSEPLGQFLPKFALNIILLGVGGGGWGEGVWKKGCWERMKIQLGSLKIFSPTEFL